MTGHDGLGSHLDEIESWRAEIEQTKRSARAIVDGLSRDAAAILDPTRPKPSRVGLIRAYIPDYPRDRDSPARVVRRGTRAAKEAAPLLRDLDREGDIAEQRQLARALAWVLDRVQDPASEIAVRQALLRCIIKVAKKLYGPIPKSRAAATKGRQVAAVPDDVLHVASQRVVQCFRSTHWRYAARLDEAEKTTQIVTLLRVWPQGPGRGKGPSAKGSKWAVVAELFTDTGLSSRPLSIHTVREEARRAQTEIRRREAAALKRAAAPKKPRPRE